MGPLIYFHYVLPHMSKPVAHLYPREIHLTINYINKTKHMRFYLSKWIYSRYAAVGDLQSAQQQQNGMYRKILSSVLL